MSEADSSCCAIALKEWAVICRMLEMGRQTVLLRKGGIREGAAGFQPEHERFWLYPTQFHQGAEQLDARFSDLLVSASELRTGDNRIVLRSLAMVERTQYLTTLKQALALTGLHGWSEDVIRQRFAYRQPGLYLFVLRVFRTEFVHELEESPAMAGCKSWVDLPDSLPTGVLSPVIDEQAFSQATADIKTLLATA